MAAARRTTEAGMASTPSKESETAGFIDGILADKNREVQEFEEEYAFTPADLDFRNFTTDAAAVRGRIRFADVEGRILEPLGRDGYSSEKAARGGYDYRAHRPPQGDLSFGQQLTKVPWFAIAIIHNLEAGGDFNRHLQMATRQRCAPCMRPPSARSGIRHSPGRRARSTPWNMTG